MKVRKKEEGAKKIWAKGLKEDSKGKRVYRIVLNNDAAKQTINQSE